MIAENIRRFRRRRQMTQADLADRLYVTQQTVAKWESGSSFPQLDRLQEIADVLDCTKEQLLFDESDLTEEIALNCTESLKAHIAELEQKKTPEDPIEAMHDYFDLHFSRISLSRNSRNTGPAGEYKLHVHMTPEEKRILGKFKNWRRLKL